MSNFNIPLFIRGKLIAEDWVEFGGRGSASFFKAPDIHKYVDELPLKNPMAMADLYTVSFEEILNVLEQLGTALDFATNPYRQEAYEAGLVAANYPAEILKSSYVQLPMVFNRESIREIAEQRIGVDYLEGWVNQTLADGRDLRIRAFGARTLHISGG